MSAVARLLPGSIAALEQRRAGLTKAISRLPRGCSERRTLEARQREITRSLLRLEIALPAAAEQPAPASEPETTEEPTARKPYYWEDRD